MSHRLKQLTRQAWEKRRETGRIGRNRSTSKCEDCRRHNSGRPNWGHQGTCEVDPHRFTTPQVRNFLARTLAQTISNMQSPFIAHRIRAANIAVAEQERRSESFAMKTGISTNGSMVKNHISLRTEFGLSATRRTSFQSWFQACQVLPRHLHQLHGHL